MSSASTASAAIARATSRPPPLAAPRANVEQRGCGRAGQQMAELRRCRDDERAIEVHVFLMVFLRKLCYNNDGPCVWSVEMKRQKESDNYITRL